MALLELAAHSLPLPLSFLVREQQGGNGPLLDELRHLPPVMCRAGPGQKPNSALCSRWDPGSAGRCVYKGEAEKTMDHTRSISPGDTSRGGRPTGKVCVRQLRAQERGAAHARRSRAMPSVTRPCQRLRSRRGGSGRRQERSGARRARRALRPRASLPLDVQTPFLLPRGGCPCTCPIMKSTGFGVSKP